MVKQEPIEYDIEPVEEPEYINPNENTPKEVQELKDIVIRLKLSISRKMKTRNVNVFLTAVSIIVMTVYFIGRRQSL